MESYTTFRARLLAGDTTCTAAVVDAFERLDAHVELNAFLTPMREHALARAAEVDAKVAAGDDVGALAGMIVAVKDNIAVKDVRLSCGSKMLGDFTSLYSATAVARLEAADAIIIGKTNLDEFAMGSSNENSAFGPVLNPLDPTRVPGGSSGGSAAAVAAGICHASLGSETGGSVRQPAAFTGTVGVKPTYGRVSRYGLVAFASSLDQIGPFARTLDDAALLLEAIAGHDDHDATSSRTTVPRYVDALGKSDVAGWRIGVPTEYVVEGMEASVVETMVKAKQRFVDAGAEIVEISLPHTEYVIPTYYVIATAEASSNLARFDGARYGYRSPNATTVDEMYEMSRSEGFGPEVKRRIMLGTFVLSSGYYDAYYRKAQQVRTLIKRDFDRAFESVDLILTPTAPTAAFRFGEKTADPIAMYLSDIFTAAANIAGVPAISVPFGADAASGLPLGVQLIAPSFEEGKMFLGAGVLEN